MSTSSSSTRSEPGSSTSDSAQTRSKLMPATAWSSRPGRAPRRASMVPISRSCSSGSADLLDDVGEEAAHDEAAGGLGVDAARAEVEQLLVVEPAGGAGVAGADDLAGLDLQVGHRVGAGAVGEHQVAVELVGVGAVAAGRMRTSPIQTVRASSPCSAPLYTTLLRQLRHGVVDPEPVLLVLGLVGEVDAEELGRAAGAGVLHVADQPDEVAAEGDHDLLEGRVPADDGVVLAAVDRAGRPVLHRDERDVARRRRRGRRRRRRSGPGRCGRARSSPWRRRRPRRPAGPRRRRRRRCRPGPG